MCVLLPALSKYPLFQNIPNFVKLNMMNCLKRSTHAVGFEKHFVL
jgi:hypothetical protein